MLPSSSPGEATRVGYRTTLRVHFHETDAMGVVHHSNYFCWFEIARFAFAREILGIAAEDLRQHDIVIPILMTQSTHFLPARMDDEIEVFTQMGLYETARFACRHEVVLAGTSQLLAHGASEHAFLRPNWRPYLTIPPLFQDKVAQARVEHPDWFSDMAPGRRVRSPR